jgi:hypothetical protein
MMLTKRRCSKKTSFFAGGPQIVRRKYCEPLGEIITLSQSFVWGLFHLRTLTIFFLFESLATREPPPSENQCTIAAVLKLRVATLLGVAKLLKSVAKYQMEKFRIFEYMA